MIKNFSIFKKDNSGDDNKPNRRITAKVGENYIDIGVGWVKQDKNGTPYISCKLEDERTYENKEQQTIKVEGWVLITEAEYNKLTGIPEEKTPDTVFDDF